jgi:hypothetical protein
MRIKFPNYTRAVTLALAFVFVLCASAQQADAVERSGVFVVGLETDRSTYALGQPIKLRFTIRNVTDGPIFATTNVPWAMFSLSVVDSGNQPLSTEGTEGYRISSADHRRYASGTTITVHYTDRNTGLTTAWVPISFWGYNFTTPGRYVITATPHLLGIPEGPAPQQWFTTSSDDRSNPVVITISR